MMASNKITRTHVEVSVLEMREGNKSHVLHLRNSAGIGWSFVFFFIKKILNRAGKS